jgi:hypothetical protein
MTKIEKFKEAKSIATDIANSVAYALGRDSPENDKHDFTCSFTGILKQQWAPMSFSIGISYGYYGSSSGYSCTSEHLGRYLAMAINAHKATLLDCAAKLAKEDQEKARKEAEAEARSVLQETTH